MKPDYIITTGDVVQGWLEDNGESVESLSHALGLTLEETQQLLSGNLHLTEHIVNKLETFTGTPARIWWLFEETYRKNTGE